MIVVRTKIDLLGERAVRPQGIELLLGKGLPCFEFSAREYREMRELLVGVVRCWMGWVVGWSSS